ncbi:MAG TPA: DUF4062 domain-containing protein [Streptosporangiaceae bacterium]
MIRTPDQRVRVFVSSTLEELAAERQAVTTAITQLRLTPVLFELGARPYPPRDLYRAYLEQSDVFIGIYAASYWWVAPGMDVSGLEDEYRLSAGKPRLIYTKKASRREPRLTSFLEMIQAEGVVSYRRFEDADELGALVADDLALLLTERFASPPAAHSAAPLPAMRRPLVDRAEELRAVTAMLLQADVGLVTLTGPGGVGKTTLALAAAHAAAGQFADGAAFISLETLTDPAMIRVTAARQLGIPTPPGQTVDESLVAFFGPRHLLLVVDNVEQLVSAAPLADLGTCPNGSGRCVRLSPGAMTCLRRPSSACSGSSGCSPADSRSRRRRGSSRTARTTLIRSRRSARWSARVSCSSSRWTRPPRATTCWRRSASSRSSSSRRPERQARRAAATPNWSGT